MYKQKNGYGCGMYAVANALSQHDFITDERLELSKVNGNLIGQLSKWLQMDGHNIYIDALFYSHVEDKLPECYFDYHPTHVNGPENDIVLPVLFNVQFSEEGKRHMVAGKIDNNKSLFLYDSLSNDVVETKISELNNKYYRVFGFFIFMDVDTGDYIFLS